MRSERRRLVMLVLAGALLTSPLVAAAQSSGRGGLFNYRAQARDTLIGLGKRLLREPGRWQELQHSNHILDPRHIPIGTSILIPYAWLRLSPETASVRSASGTVQGNTGPLVPGQTLPEGSLIQTRADGSASIDFADGSVVTVQSSSVVHLEELQRISGVPAAHDIRVKLETGRIQSTVRPHGDAGRFEIVTPVAVSAVRGTSFRSAFHEDTQAAANETLEGAVAVAGEASSVTVPAGFGTRVDRGGAPLPPVPLLPAPDLSSVADVNTGAHLHLTWGAVANALRYRVQLAPDSNFQTIITDETTSATQLDVAAPVDGPYWLRVRAIDSHGLEGLDATKAVKQHRLPAAPALDSPAAGERVIGPAVLLRWTSIDAAAGYRIEVARDMAFTDLLTQADVPGADLTLRDVPVGHYFWRVASRSHEGELGDWSPSRDLAVRPPAPTPEQPDMQRRGMQLRWNGERGARYRVQIAQRADFSRLVLDQIVDAPQLSTRRLSPGVYYARVQTIDGDGHADPFGEPREFQVPLPRWVPAAAVLVVLLVLIH
jgi:hypothetical protein